MSGWVASRVFEQPELWLWMFPDDEALAVYQQAEYAQRRQIIQASLRLLLHVMTPKADAVYLFRNKDGTYRGEFGHHPVGMNHQQSYRAEMILQWQDGQFMIVKNRDAGYDTNS